MAKDPRHVRIYPIEPLLALAGIDDSVSSAEISKRSGVSREMVGRARKDKILTEYMADALALGLGFHPALIWPELYAQGAA